MSKEVSLSAETPAVPIVKENKIFLSRAADAMSKAILFSPLKSGRFYIQDNSNRISEGGCFYVKGGFSGPMTRDIFISPVRAAAPLSKNVPISALRAADAMSKTI
jgi:hypothetical protein